jgi:hypothetical protein
VSYNPVILCCDRRRRLRSRRVGIRKRNNARNSHSIPTKLANKRLESSRRASELRQRHEIPFTQEREQIVAHIWSWKDLRNEGALEAFEEGGTYCSHAIAVRYEST